MHNTLKQLIAMSWITLAFPLALQAEPSASDGHGICDTHEPPHGHRWEQGALQPGAMPPGSMMHNDDRFLPGLPPFLIGLKLTDAQEEKIFSLLYAQIPAMRDNAKQHRQVMEELQALSNAQKFDDAKAQQLADKLAALSKEMILMRVRNDYRILSLLTTEQRQQMQSRSTDRDDKAAQESVSKEPTQFEQRYKKPASRVTGIIPI